MKLSLNPVFYALLFCFTGASAYITFLFTSSLAQDEIQKVIFSVLGFSFDILKCLLPATILLCWSRREYKNSLMVCLVYALLTSFSFYASYKMLDTAREKEIKQTLAYTSLQKELDGYQTSYDKLVAMDYITKANAEYGGKIKVTAGQMTAMLDAGITIKELLSNPDFLMNIALAILLEFSVLACHISIAVRGFNGLSEEKTGLKSDELTERPTSNGAASANLSDDLQTKSEPQPDEIKPKYQASSDEEILALLRSGSVKPTAHFMKQDIGIGKSKANRILKIFAQEQEQAKADNNKSMLKNDIPSSNIILLPTYRN